MEKYIIVRASDSDAIQALVNQRIDSGYTPSGGLALNSAGSYLQAMVLKPVEVPFKENQTYAVSSENGELSVKAVDDAPIGYCPFCGAKGWMRERRPNGNDQCENRHTYPSVDALKEPVYAWQKSYLDEFKNGFNHRLSNEELDMLRFLENNRLDDVLTAHHSSVILGSLVAKQFAEYYRKEGSPDDYCMITKKGIERLQCVVEHGENPNRAKKIYLNLCKDSTYYLGGAYNTFVDAQNNKPHDLKYFVKTIEVELPIESKEPEQTSSIKAGDKVSLKFGDKRLNGDYIIHDPEAFARVHNENPASLGETKHWGDKI